MPRFCADCKHCKITGAGDYRCRRLVMVPHITQLVTGEQWKQKDSDCFEERQVSGNGFCGRAGDFWEPKPEL